MAENIWKISINLSNDIDLQRALKNAGVSDDTPVTELAVTGTFNYIHFSDIFDKMNKSLRELDLRAAFYDAYYIKKYEFSLFRNEKRYNQLEVSYTDCDTLVSISFPESVTQLRPDLFNRFSNLTSIIVPDDHPAYSSENGVLFSKDKLTLFRYPAGCKGKYVIPDTVTKIGGHAFNACTGLQSVILPPSVVTIGKLAFYDCAALQSFVISDSVIEIGNSAFSGCKGLTSIIIPPSVETIGDYSFKGCTGLQSIVVPLSVKKVGDTAFARCTGLKSLKIINPAVKLGKGAFYNCTALTTLDMPKSVKYKQNNVFEGCTKLPLYNELVEENKIKAIKQTKIQQLKKTNAYEWVDTLMKNSAYPYKIIRQANKLQLLVFINDRHKLVIPVSFKDFQSVIPKLMDAIQRFETAINEFGTIYIDNMINDRKGWTIHHLPTARQNELELK